MIIRRRILFLITFPLLFSSPHPASAQPHPARHILTTHDWVAPVEKTPAEFYVYQFETDSLGGNSATRTHFHANGISKTPFEWHFTKRFDSTYIQLENDTARTELFALKTISDPEQPFLLKWADRLENGPDCYAELPIKGAFEEAMINLRLYGHGKFYCGAENFFRFFDDGRFETHKTRGRWNAGIFRNFVLLDDDHWLRVEHRPDGRIYLVDQHGNRFD